MKNWHVWEAMGVIALCLAMEIAMPGVWGIRTALRVMYVKLAVCTQICRQDCVLWHALSLTASTTALPAIAALGANSHK